MSKGKNIHIVPRGRGWAVKQEGQKAPISTHHPKDRADETARQIAHREHVELVIHRKDGTIQDKDSFGRDPFPPRDRQR